MSSLPPFKLAPAVAFGADAVHANPLLVDALGRGPRLPLGAGDDEDADPLPGSRTRLHALDPHLHCSIIGTCIGTDGLRKILRRFIDVAGASDLTLHHDAVALVTEQPVVAKAIGKALDRRHEAVLRRFETLEDAGTLEAAWKDALRQGDVPGAYWAVLTHRLVTPALRQQVFGDVHMLSHLVGAANRADIRRLIALQEENEALREQLDRQHDRAAALLRERDALLSREREQAAEAAGARLAARTPTLLDDGAALRAQVEVQTARRERAETAAEVAAEESGRLAEERDRLREHVAAVAGELHAAESELLSRDRTSGPPPLTAALAGSRVLYVGGRPSTTATIRDLVDRSEAAFRKHDGGLEDRKGLLDAAVGWATLVVFPVDCIDHDSALRLKRICARFGTRFVALRSASVASFIAAVTGPPPTGTDGPPLCRRHA